MPDAKVLITGVSSFFGLRLAQRLASDGTVSTVIGVDLHEPHEHVPGMQFVRADIGSPMIARVLQATAANVLVHTNIASTPGRMGGRSRMKENNVIGTMQLLAAAQRSEHLERVVVRSSTAVYGFRSGEPSIIPEDHTRRDVHLVGYGKDCAEAEQYARNFGRRREDVDLVILRTQNLVGPTVKTNIADYLSLPAVPTGAGFDPRLQLLHEDDAIEALRLAVGSHHSGIYNIAADGVVYLSQAIRLLGRVPLPLPSPAASLSAAIVRRFGWIDFPTDQLGLILYGRVVDTRRAREELGFRPRYTTREAILSLRSGGSRSSRVSTAVETPEPV